ncbi:PEP-CTERM sorting domain-containing protein [Crocosphaera sp. XPORK-15E]|uniref:PEP-CTERM sorting domain-containing protein n=1 Tax=Crocosphaera sp. XPORK-15E TaxID=3110247 RepID=UPI002B1EB67F|nr:PEP-CTERM sorting domain-containing protein [Crocosphaera sp. XPORK-15E]MEA5533810.1 PEP-CTERM sorting domain-containing protein [Crocosphaera sp. XPORK-15E]
MTLTKLIDFTKGCKNNLSKIAIASSVLVVSSLAIAPVQAATFDAATDFSATNNPNGVWSYGDSNTLGSVFNLYTNKYTDVTGLDVWFGSDAATPTNPAIVQNPTASTVTNICCQLLPGQLSLHPGPQGQYSIVRWTAPHSGLFSLATTFSGTDFVGPTSTDVHVLSNGTSLFNDFVNGFGSPSAKNFSTTLSIAVGDTIDFAVGFGNNGNFFSDNTGLSAILTTISASEPSTIPEPSSILGILSLGVLGIGAALKRKP